MNTKTITGLVALLMLASPLAAMGVGAEVTDPDNYECPGPGDDPDLLFVALCNVADQLGGSFTAEDADDDGHPDRAMVPDGNGGTVPVQIDYLADGANTLLEPVPGIQVYGDGGVTTVGGLRVEKGEDDEGGYTHIVLPVPVVAPTVVFSDDGGMTLSDVYIQDLTPDNAPTYDFVSDLDNDGDPDVQEIQGCQSNPLNAAANCGDYDGDGVPNGNEPGFDRDPRLDGDGDGLTDAEETTGFTITPKNADGTDDTLYTVDTDPLKKDTDSDGLDDDVEVAGWSVTVQHDDGTAYTYTVKPDPTHADHDDDLLNDTVEMDAGTNPFVADSDGDGLTDKQEVDDDEAGESLDGMGLVVLRAADPNADPTDADTDGDGTNDGDEVANGDDPNDDEPAHLTDVQPPGTTIPEPHRIRTDPDCRDPNAWGDGSCGSASPENPGIDGADPHDTDGDGETDEPNNQEDLVETRLFYVDPDEEDYDPATDDPQHGFRGTDGLTVRVYDPTTVGGTSQNAATLRLGDVTATEATEVLVLEVAGAATVCVLDGPALHMSDAAFDPDGDVPCGDPATPSTDELNETLGVLDGILEAEARDTDGDGQPDALVVRYPTGPCDPSGAVGPPCEQTEAVVPLGISDADGDSVPDAVDNCPGDANPDQADTDLDRMGDACDDENAVLCPDPVLGWICIVKVPGAGDVPEDYREIFGWFLRSCSDPEHSPQDPCYRGYGYTGIGIYFNGNYIVI